jgi:hypothetical protein
LQSKLAQQQKQIEALTAGLQKVSAELGEQTCTANSHEHLPSGNQKRFWRDPVKRAGMSMADVPWAVDSQPIQHAADAKNNNASAQKLNCLPRTMKR